MGVRRPESEAGNGKVGVTTGHRRRQEDNRQHGCSRDRTDRPLRFARGMHDQHQTPFAANRTGTPCSAFRLANRQPHPGTSPGRKPAGDAGKAGPGRPERPAARGPIPDQPKAATAEGFEPRLRTARQTDEDPRNPEAERAGSTVGNVPQAVDDELPLHPCAWRPCAVCGPSRRGGEQDAERQTGTFERQTSPDDGRLIGCA